MPVTEYNDPITYQQLYWLLVLPVSGYALARTVGVLRLYVINWGVLPPVLKAGAGFVAADLLFANFLLRDVIHIFTGKLEGGLGCDLSAIVAITAISFLMISSSILAWATSCLVENKRVSDGDLAIRFAAALALAVGTAAGYTGAGSVGDFRGLYCCIAKDKLTASTFTPMICFTIYAIASMVTFYGSAVRSSNKIMLSAAATAGSDKSGSKGKPTNRLLFFGLKVTGAFFFSWSGILLSSLTRVIGGDVIPIQFDMAAALLAKLQPVWNAAILSEALERSTNKSRPGAPGTKSAPSPSPSVAISVAAWNDINRKVALLERRYPE